MNNLIFHAPGSPNLKQSGMEPSPLAFILTRVNFRLALPYAPKVFGEKSAGGTFFPKNFGGIWQSQPRINPGENFSITRNYYVYEKNLDF